MKVNIVAPQQHRCGQRAILRGRKGDVALLIIGDFAGPVGMFDAPVIVHFDAARFEFCRLVLQQRREAILRKRQPKSALQPPIADKPPRRRIGRSGEN